MPQETFLTAANPPAPLAERLRPQNLDEFAGQEHLIGKGKVLRRMIEGDLVSSMIFWGPPGVGKTTLAQIIAHQTKSHFINFSAVTSGIKEIRQVMEQAESDRHFGIRTIVFVDEIHRFNKAQQDAFLPYVEKGSIILIGATTENPSFEVNSALLSRCRVFEFYPLTTEDILSALTAALADEERGFGKQAIEMEGDALLRIASIANGDCRNALNALELAVLTTSPAEDGIIHITPEIAAESSQRKVMKCDEQLYYDMLSAFCKSLRGGDSDAALAWFARLIYAGVDARIIARRLIAHASEDIGLANPNALLLANACFDTVHKIGMPEARITLAETTIYLATSPKSNSAYMAINKAMSLVEHDTTNRPVPLHLRNAPTKLMSEAGYGKGYKYAHDFAGGFVEQEFLPESLAGTKFYEPNTGNATEAKIAQRMQELWKDKYK